MTKAELSPGFKTNDDMVKDSIKPIVCLKSFETIVANQLMKYLKNIFDLIVYA